MKRFPCGQTNKVSRREFIYSLGASLGSVAFTDLLAKEAGPLTPKTPMGPAKAKACIMLFMEGGPSQADTFDPKPELNALHLKESTRTNGLAKGPSCESVEGKWKADFEFSLRSSVCKARCTRLRCTPSWDAMARMLRPSCRLACTCSKSWARSIFCLTGVSIRALYTIHLTETVC